MANRHLGNNYLNNNLNMLSYSNASKNQFTPPRNYKQETPLSPHNLGQLQSLLQRQRHKFRQSKQRLENQLDNQRRIRIDFENKLIKLKDQFSKKDIIISQLQFKQNNLLHQIQDLTIQNNRLKNQLNRLQETYGNKIYDLQGQLLSQGKRFDQTTHQYNSEFEKFKKQGQQYIQRMNFEYQRKIRNLEEKLKLTQNQRKQLALQNRKLNDLLINEKLTHEEQLRQLTNRIRQDQTKKYQISMKNYELKLKSLEQTKDALNRKNQDLYRINQDKQRIIQNIQTQKNEQISRLNQQIINLTNSNSQLNFMYEKSKAQLAQKQSRLSRNHGQNDQQLYLLREQIEQKKKEIQYLKSNIRQLNQNLKDVQMSNERKKSELIQRLNYAQSQGRKYKQQYSKICEILKAKINETINHTAVSSYKR